MSCPIAPSRRNVLTTRTASAAPPGLFAEGPGGAAEAVRVVKTLRRDGAIGSLVPGSDSLWGDLASAIGVEALKLQAHPDREPFGQAREAGWECTVCLDPPEAWITWTENGAQVRVDYLPTPPVARKEHERRTTITAAVLGVCARLCVGHLNATARRYSRPKNTASTNDTAAVLARAAAARLDQPAPTKDGHTSHLTEAGTLPQHRAGHSRTKERSDRNARRTHCPGISPA